MRILARIIQFLLWLVIFWWATWIARKIFQWIFSRSVLRPKQAQDALEPKSLRRDPWCGTYVSPEISLTLESEGQTFHFCSADCRERYRSTHLRAASG